MQTLNNLIPIMPERILPHPDNPRKEFGDLSELTQSIKENGILQEITVIPEYCLDTPKDEQKNPDTSFMVNSENKFYVLMGHRRLEAYKNTGLSVPVKCKVAYNISRSEQIGIMLEENVQRNELTVPEQIESFQLMLDLGETVETISEKTGFSRTTIRKRVKNSDVVEQLKGSAFQLSISDLAELAKVDTEEKRYILDRARSSSDIEYFVNESIKKKERVKKQNVLIEKLEARGVMPYDDDAKEIYPNWWHMKYVREISIDGDDELDDLFGDEYYGIPSAYSTSITIKRPSVQVKTEEETEEDREEREKEERIEANKAIIDSVTEALHTHLADYAKSLAAGELKVPDDFTYEDAEKIIAEGDIDISMRYYVAHLTGKFAYQLTDEDMEEARKKFLTDFRIMTIVEDVCDLGDLEIITYDGEYDEESAKGWEETLNHAYKAGFKTPDISELDVEGIPDDETLDDILNGTSKLYED